MNEEGQCMAKGKVLHDFVKTRVRCFIYKKGINSNPQTVPTNTEKNKALNYNFNRQ